MSRFNDLERLPLLGEGGTARVFAVTENGTDYALKVARDPIDRNAAAQLEREAKALSRVAHPNLIPIAEHGILEDGRRFLLLPRLVGETVAARLARGPIPNALPLFSEIAGALGALHKAGLVHRDLKPSNVFLVEGGAHAILLDCGLAKAPGTEASTITREGGARGTASFMAPERFFGEAATVASDIYELGAVLYAMLTAKLPWAEPESIESRLFALLPEEQGVALPKALSETLMTSLSTRPENRPKGTDDFTRKIMGKP